MSSLGIDWQRIRRERGRLVILKALAEQVNGTLDSSVLEDILRMFAIAEDRIWIHEQMDYLQASEAVTLVSAGSVKIATLTRRGRRHLDREVVLEGVSRPAEPGD